MIFSLRKWLERAKFALLFVLLTYILYHGIAWFSAWVQPIQKYKHPEGRAVKVFQPKSFEMEHGTLKERLKFFYWYGE